MEAFPFSDHELRQFEREAYLSVARPVFEKRDFENLRDYFFSFVESVPVEWRARNFCNSQDFDPKIADWVGRRELLRLVEPFLGQDLALWSLGVCYKPPQSKYRVGWHKDSEFWARDNLLQPLQVINVFFPLTRMDERNGCLRVLPGRNDPSPLAHQTVSDPEFAFFFKEIADDAVDLSQSVPVPMAENTFCLLRENIIHASGPNNSTEPRLAISIRYISTRSKYSPSEFDQRRLYLLQGIDRAGNRYTPLDSRGSIGGFSWSDAPSASPTESSSNAK